MTTTVTGALKEGLKGLEHDLGLFAQGGKGATSRKTPDEILQRCDRLSLDPKPLVYASRMAAKVDSAAVQDGYQLYHHTFFTIDALHRAMTQAKLDRSEKVDALKRLARFAKTTEPE